ncbi:MAG: hypothetical protein PHE25_04590 [Candidatus Gracilibacteria bacterium]|nr:hypothetical protein [Candidatus Gracilibacteria bacterium]
MSKRNVPVCVNNLEAVNSSPFIEEFRKVIDNFFKSGDKGPSFKTTGYYQDALDKYKNKKEISYEEFKELIGLLNNPNFIELAKQQLENFVPVGWRVKETVVFYSKDGININGLKSEFIRQMFIRIISDVKSDVDEVLNSGLQEHILASDENVVVFNLNGEIYARFLTSTNAETVEKIESFSYDLSLFSIKKPEGVIIVDNQFQQVSEDGKYFTQVKFYNYGDELVVEAEEGDKKKGGMTTLYDKDLNSLYSDTTEARSSVGRFDLSVFNNYGIICIKEKEKRCDSIFNGKCEKISPEGRTYCTSINPKELYTTGYILVVNPDGEQDYIGTLLGYDNNGKLIYCHSGNIYMNDFKDGFFRKVISYDVEHKPIYEIIPNNSIIPEKPVVKKSKMRNTV